MAFLDTGFNLLRDVINTDLSSGQAGTSTYPPRATQTGLLLPVAATLNTLSTKIVSEDTITVTHVVTTTEANGSSLTEWEVLGNADATDYTRILRTGLAKTAVMEVTMITAFILERT